MCATSTAFVEPSPAGRSVPIPSGIPITTWAAFFRWTALLAAIGSSAGCSLFRGSNDESDLSLASFGVHASVEQRGAVESEVMDFSDQLVLKVAQAMDEVRNRVGGPEARARTQAWKVSHANAATIIATNPNVFVALLDMVVLVSLGRMVIEDDWVKTYGEAAQPAVAAYRALEEMVWNLAREHLKPPQEEDLRTLIDDWRAKNPDQRYVSLIRFRDFARERLEAPTQQKKRRFDSLFSLLYLDPLSNLDPAVKELAQARSLVNRVLFQLHRTPNLLSWQAELLVYRLLRAPEIQSLTSDVSKFTGALDEATDIARALPQQIAAERRSMVQDLEQHGPLLKELLQDVKTSLAEGQGMASSVDGAAKSIGNLIPDDAGCEDNPSQSEPAAVAAAPSAVPSDPPPESGHGFDVRDYGSAAVDISDAAERVNGLVTSLSQLIESPAWEARAEDIRRTAAEARAEGSKLIWQAFWLGGALVLVLVVTSSGAAMGVLKWTEARRKRSRPRAGAIQRR